jgi:hypothetical protein
MAWGKSAAQKAASAPPSTFMYVPLVSLATTPKLTQARRKLLPLLILIAVLGGAAFVAYHLYLAVNQISNAATDKMQSKNVVFTKDGLKVGVKELKNESYVDKTQGYLVQAWNLSSWPGYKSKLWNKQPADKVEARKP